MKELQAILEAWSASRASGQRAALATLVKVEGSSYRRAGARMLIGEDGTTVGGISGGCLEADVIEVARQVMAENQSRLLCYDTTDERDLILGTGLGCNGVVRILVQPLHNHAKNSVLDALAHCLATRQLCVVATVFRAEDELAIPGSLLMQVNDTIVSDIAEAELVERLAIATSQALRDGGPGNYQVEVRGERVEALIEILTPPPPLVIFGAGSDALPVVRLAKELGWHVTVVDDRPLNATAARLSQADAILTCAIAAVPARVTLSDETIALIMTHNFVRDLELLRILLPSPACYVGLLGPRRRAERILAFLQSEGIAPESAQARLHSPVGLDIGAETAEEIALSIIAEIKAFLTGRGGASLRHRAGPIHSHGA